MQQLQIVSHNPILSLDDPEYVFWDPLHVVVVLCSSLVCAHYVVSGGLAWSAHSVPLGIL